MRANDLPFPISTYSFGGPRPPASAQLRPASMRRSYKLAVAGMFATVSAVAITFGPTKTETPDASSATRSMESLRQNEPEDAARSPNDAEVLMNLDSFQTVHFPQTQSNLRPGSGPIGHSAYSRVPHPKLAQPGTSRRMAPTVEASLKSDPSMAVERREAMADVDASSMVPRQIECGLSCSRHTAGDTDAVGEDVVVATADLAEVSGGTSLAVGAPTEPGSESSEGLIPSLTQKPLADITERGVLLADAQGATPAGPVLGTVAAEMSAASAENRGKVPGAVGVASADSLQLGDIGQATLSASDAAEHSSVAADARSTAPAKIALHLDRVRKRYVELATPEPLSGGRGSAVADTAPAQGVGSPVDGLHTGESTSRVVVHDNELVAIELGELISLFEARLDRPLFVWMRSSAAASKFVTAETLAAAGIKATYDPASKQLVLTVAKD